MRVVGIDPGNQGGVAFLSGEKLVDAVSMPTLREKVAKAAKGKVRTEPDFDELIQVFDRIAAFEPDLVALEQLWAMAGDSAQTCFSLGGSYKALRMALHTHRLPYQLIAPGAWKRSDEYKPYKLWGAGDEGKEIAIDIVRTLYPQDFTRCICPLRKGSTTRRNKPHDGRADAVLIARFAQKRGIADGYVRAV
jgi:hypothetical protein